MTRELQRFVSLVPSHTAPTQKGGYGRADGFIVFHKYIANDESYAVFTLNLKGAAYRPSMIGGLAYWDATPVSMVMIDF